MYVMLINTALVCCMNSFHIPFCLQTSCRCIDLYSVSYYSHAAEEPQLSSPVEHCHSGDTAAEQSVGATPASRQQLDSSPHLALQSDRSAAQQSMPRSAASGLQPYCSPRFHEMEVLQCIAPHYCAHELIAAIIKAAADLYCHCDYSVVGPGQ